MKEQLITFETAKLAKEKGYSKLHCEVAYKAADKQLYGDRGDYTDYPAPIQSLLQKWLREEHNIHITITSISQESWQYHITKPGQRLGDNYEEDFYTYEESLESGLHQALKLI